MIDPLEWIFGAAGLALGSITPLLLLMAIIRWLTRSGSSAAETEEAAAEPGAEAEVEEPQETTTDSAEEAEVAGVRVPAPEERMVRVHSTRDHSHAFVLRAILRDAGIWAFVTGDNNALGIFGLSEMSLHVPAGDALRARQLIAEAEGEALEAQALEGRAACPACGYDLRATPHRCPECGLRLSGSASE